jgi:hypothetical protein
MAMQAKARDRRRRRIVSPQCDIAGSLSLTLLPFFNKSCRYFDGVLQDLHGQLQAGLHVWATSLRHGDRPPLMTEVKLTEPLRSPPSVIREVSLSEYIKPGEFCSTHDYSPCPVPLPGDPVVKYVRHTRGQRSHTDNLIVTCEQCGLDLAALLHDELQIGKPGN